MARVSRKALRPRQYVFNRLSSSRIKRLQEGVKKLREKEMLDMMAARAAVRALGRSEAARHAENIMAGIKQSDPENDQIQALEKELEELRQKKRSLFATLKKTLDTDAAASAKDVEMGVVSPAGKERSEERSMNRKDSTRKETSKRNCSSPVREGTKEATKKESMRKDLVKKEGVKKANMNNDGVKHDSSRQGVSDEGRIWTSMKNAERSGVTPTSRGR